MQKLLTILAVLTVIATPAFASHKSTASQNEKKIAIGRSGLHSFAMVPGPGSSRVPAFDYRRGTSAYPFGPGINFPYPDRPYGDPDHD
jgi:hypothetical protein